MLLIGRCLALDPTVSPKFKWFGTRSAISMNAPDSIFCTRLGGTGGIDEPEVSAGVPRCVVGQEALLWFGRRTSTWSRSRPEGGGYRIDLRCYSNLSRCPYGMLNKLQWESLESQRDQFRLIMLYNILKQNIYLPSEYIPEFHSQISQYQLQTRTCHMLRLAETYFFFFFFFF